LSTKKVQKKQKFIVTSALPYVNGIKHLGNFIGSLLPADIYARYLRAQGHDVLCVCATDEHGTPAELAALEEGLEVADYCKKYHEIQKQIYKDFLLSFDIFGRTSDKANHKITQHLFLKLYENGLIEERETTQLFSIDDQRFLPDRFVRGICPYCKYENARGDQCENCTKVLDPLDLIEPKSAISGSKNVEARISKHLYINLPKMENVIGQWIETKKDTWPKTSYSIAKKWISEGLKSRSITRDLKWGIPVPLKGYEDKVFYVWFDAPIGYIGASIEWSEQTGKSWENYWKDPETKLYQFMGKDNIPFHTVTWPSAMKGADDGFALADMVKGFEWLNYEGGKFSTSLKRGIFTDQALKIFPPDHWRYYLILIAPERHDTDFQWSGFQSAINNDLANVLGNFVHRTLTFIHRYFNGVVPKQSNLDADDKAILESIKQTITNLRKNFVDVEFQKSLVELRSLWQSANQYFQVKEPWKLVKEDIEKAGTVLSVCVHICKSIAILNQVFIPTATDKIFEYLGLEKQDVLLWDTATNHKDLIGKQLPSDPKPLFDKIEDKEIKKLEEQFSGVKGVEEKLTDVKGGQKGKKRKETPKQEKLLPEGIITIDDFIKVHIKVGLVKKASKLEKSRKLLQIEVDIGEEKPRQILAGLAEHIDPKKLIGKKLLVLANLEPKKLAGLESQGMILAYKSQSDTGDDQFNVIQVSESAIVGSRIS
jgi:methionyl-tRNA synthetase